MAAPFPGQISQFQIGSYFASNYYQMLQNQPQLVHQFYNDASTMVKLDVFTMETATAIGMLQIHNLVMSLKMSGIEIKTWQCLESWSGGILVMVSGFVQMRDWPRRRRFVQSFLLAPQEKGFFVLNDMFHVLDQEQGPQFLGSVSVFMQNGFGTNVPISNPEPEESEVQSKEILAAPQPESETVDKYSIHEPQVESLPPEPQPVIDEVQSMAETEPELPQPSPAPVSVPEPETVVAPVSAPTQAQAPAPPPSQSKVTAAISVVAPVSEPESMPVPAQSREVEPDVVGEQPKLSYASVLRSKGQSQPGQMPHHHTAPSNRTSTARPTPVEAKPVIQPLQSNSAPLLEKPIHEPIQEPIAEDEGESLSVYVGNVAPSTQIHDLEQVFKAFGRLRPDGIAIRSRKEMGAFFAFIDFEEFSGVQNAIKASPIQLKGRLVHVEGRRPNSSTSRGPRMAGGAGTRIYPSEPSRGRFSGGASRSSSDRDYANRPGFLRRGPAKGGFSDRAPRNGPAS